MKHFFTVFLLFLLINLPSSASVYNIVVAKDGSGKYTSIGTALQRMSADPSRRVIFIKNGVYKEKLEIIATYKNVCLIGESKDGVIIQFDDYAGKSATSSSTAQSYTFKIEGDGFYAENITFQNTATQAQAVAIYTKADTMAFKNCNFLGYQDTHFADNGRQYYLNCTIRGDVDFIFGNAAGIFEHCTIVSSNRKGGYVTAPSEALNTANNTLHGFLFRNCEIIPEEGLGDNTCYLGRPWGDNASSVYLNCKIGSHIKTGGWSVWTTDQSNDDHDNHESAFFAEYNSTNLSGNSLDISARESWSKQLTAEDTSAYSVKQYFSGWTPYHKTKAVKAPEIVSRSGNTVTWSGIEEARGYVILRNDSVVDFTEETTFTIHPDYTLGNYKIKTAGQYGALSKSSSLATDITSPKLHTFVVVIEGNSLILPENKCVRIINITGTVVQKTFEKTTVDLHSLPNGLYIIELHRASGERNVSKFIFNRI